MAAPQITRADEARRIAWIGGTVHRIPIDGTHTDGRLTILRTTFQQGTASPVHVHDTDDETFCVLEGSMTIWAGRERWRIGPGDTAFLPRGLPHAYLVTSPSAEVLTVCTPSGMEQFFDDAGWDLAEPMPEGWRVDMSALGAIGERAGQRVLGAPLGAGELIPAEVLSRA